ncbi:SRPBCC domain-containing protein [Pseudoruegeria sp. HB172150]|uniref:SRPBCC family protein n=1 Tax=Pseudoruegeria sp. HB172150 TaxID=2721164 RepID=UPI00155668FF|nr:SRPBCC domain-containing protein [Pseudoruegeria sp. HB172150]
MPTLTIERRLDADVEKVFAFVTRTENLLKWWGPEGMHVPEHQLSFEETGPWMSVMQNAEGQRFKVSGQVTHVDPPKSVGFTWAWHDEADKRGVESHVTIRLVPAQGGGTDLTLTHVDLPDDDVAARHEMGWTSSLRKLEAMANG